MCIVAHAVAPDPTREPLLCSVQARESVQALPAASSAQATGAADKS